MRVVQLGVVQLGLVQLGVVQLRVVQMGVDPVRHHFNQKQTTLN